MLCSVVKPYACVHIASKTQQPDRCDIGCAEWPPAAALAHSVLLGTMVILKTTVLSRLLVQVS